MTSEQWLPSGSDMEDEAASAREWSGDYTAGYDAGYSDAKQLAADAVAALAALISSLSHDYTSDEIREANQTLRQLQLRLDRK
jgi:hypothetical protein